jgi:hypothetical protein
MDPLSLSASIAGLMQLTASMISYLCDVNNAPKERITFSSEISGLHNLLLLLQNRLKASNSTDPWFSSIRTLGIQHGPLDRFRSDLQKLATKLGDESTLRELGRRLTWKFDKAEIKDILLHIERIKSLVSLALTDDLM